MKKVILAMAILFLLSGCVTMHTTGTVIGVNAGYQGASLTIGYQQYANTLAEPGVCLGISTSEDITMNGIKRTTTTEFKGTK